MATDEVVKVTLDGAGLKLEREVSKAVGEQIAVLIFSGGTAEASVFRGLDTAGGIPPREVATGVTASGNAAALSVREFLNEAEAKRSPDKIAAIGVYFKDHDHKELFTRADIQKAFEDAGEPVPGNLPRDVKWTVKAGWIAPKSGAAGQYYVTNSGRNAVTKKFPKDLLKKTRVDGGTKRSGKKDGGKS